MVSDMDQIDGRSFDNPFLSLQETPNIYPNMQSIF